MPAAPKRRRWPVVLGVGLLAILVVGAVMAWRYVPLVDHARQVRAAASRLSAQASALEPAGVDRAAVERMRVDITDLRTNLLPIEEVIEGDPLASLARALPGIDDQLQAAEALVAAADALVEAGELGLSLADRVVDVRERNEADPDTAVVPELVAIMATSTAEVERISDLVATASLELERVPSDAVEPLVEVRDLMAQPLRDYGSTLESFDRIDDVLPAILGWGEQKDYLVLAQNPAELRATGGYNGTFGRIDMLDGVMVQQRFVDAHVPGFNRDLPFVEPPEALVNHLLQLDTGTESWRLPDANWWADFPQSARQALELYEIETGEGDLDGVIAINTFALDRLLEVIGPVELPQFDVTVEPGDAILVLLGATRDRREGDRKAILDALAREVVRRVLSLPPDRWLPLLDAIDDIGREDMMLVWFADETAQELAVEAGWDGQVRQDPGDYLYVVESNMAPTSKYNLVVDRSRSLQVAIDDNGDAFSSVRLDWQNNADREGEPYASLRKFSTDATGGYGAYVRLLVPQGSELVAATGAGDDEFSGVESVGEEAGRTVFANYLRMPPGESRLTYVWTTPDAAVQTDSGWEYRLTMQRQPGARPENATARVDLPRGAVVNDVTEGATVEGERVTFETTMTTDTDLLITYELPPTS